MKNNSLKQLKILGVKINSTGKGEVLKFVLNSLEKKKKFFIATPNPEIILAAQKDKKLMQALNSATVALPDGVGLKIAEPSLSIVKGREIFESLLKEANSRKMKVYLLGASPEVNEMAVNKVKTKFPQIEVRGTGDVFLDNEAYFYTKDDSDKHKEVVRHSQLNKEINSFNPDIVFVALGFPKQEKWVMNNFDDLNVGGFMVVGGALDYFAGKMAKPPEWMARSGLEWLWRGLQEPKRFKRIFNAVVVFPVYYLMKNLH